MLVALKAFSGMTLVVGGVSIPWFLQHRDEQNKTSSELEVQIPENSSSARVVRKMEKLVATKPIPKAVEENCRVIDFRDLDNVLFDLEETGNYISVACKGTNKGSSEKIPNEWRGLFPDYLFVNTREFNRMGKKFDLSTETTVFSDVEIQTIFSGSSLHASVIGRWGEVLPAIQSGQSIQAQTINFEQLKSGRIFLFFKLGQLVNKFWT